MYFVDTANSLFSTVLVGAQALATALETGKEYVFTSTTNCWIAQGATPTASAAAGSMFVPAGIPVILNGGRGVGVSVIRNTADGSCTLTPITIVR